MTNAMTDVAPGVPARSLGLAALSYLSFSTADALIKGSSAAYSVFQIATVMSLFAMLPVVVLGLAQGGVRGLLPNRWGLVLLRGVLTATGSICAWLAFSMLPLADGYAILFAAPMLVTVLSALILREEVGWRRWLATGIGFAGVMVMVRPDFATLELGHGLALAGASCGALSFVVLKRIGTRERSAPVLFILFLSILAASLPMTVRDFVMPDLTGLLAMAVAGLLMGMGQTGLVLATRSAPAVVVAPFQYSQMIWAVLFGALLFGDRPTPMLFAGMAVVVGSGLFILWRETVRRTIVTIATHGEVPARAAR
ncbi:DMT family transporter [Marinimicrococcus flavescens]|uniref:DMT family transporter n=1 Tax=Marinimicrococcus flavescens TaxID=3031815 RepID=A0AAP3UYX1_9PROT|nr:DMT family transporter [Marinimicrococcus flavescens]